MHQNNIINVVMTINFVVVANVICLFKYLLFVVAAAVVVLLCLGHP